MKHYFNSMAKVPLLTAAQEVELSKKIEAGDQSARNKMIQSNLRLVVSMAKKYRNKGCHFEDLIQEGNIGLMKSVDKYDWRRGFRFSTYACWWIRQSIVRHIDEQSRTIRVPGHITSDYNKILKAVREYTKELNREPTLDEICQATGLDKDNVKNIFESVKFTVSLDAMRTSSDDGKRNLLETIEDHSSSSPQKIIENNELFEEIKLAMTKLTDREEKILRLRFGISEDSCSKDYMISESELENLKFRSIDEQD